MTRDAAASGITRRRGFLAWLVASFSPGENPVLILLAIIVGLVGGVGAAAFHWLIETAHHVFLETPALLVDAGWLDAQSMAIARIIATPAIGGLVAGTLVWLLARHDHSHGTSEVMEAVALRGGSLAARPLLTKITAAGLLIGGGGSAGPEDPSVQIGAVAGSSVGRYLHLSERQRKTLVTAGVASTIAAIFNAPIAGVFFALEVIAGDFSAALFAPVVLASVAGSIVGRALMGMDAAFPAPAYELHNPLVETPLYGLLGMLSAIIGVGFIRAIFFSEYAFDKLRLPGPLLAGLGGLLVGLIALAVPDVLGVSYEAASSIINGSGPLGLALLGLLGAKLAATIITLGAARIGGTFAPSMVLGAMVGGLFGQGVHWLLPGLTAPPAAYALVGMGAMLNAVVRAPITAVLLLFEVTGDYEIILAIMACVVTSQMLAHVLHAESIYTERLARKGIQLRFGRDVNILELVTVGEAMTPDFTTLPNTMTINRLRALFDSTRHHGFPVLDEQGNLFGIVTVADLRKVTRQKLPPTTPIASIATRDLVVVYPDQTLNAALRQFALADVGRMPVVERGDPHKLLGMLRRTDIVKAYQRGTMRREEMELRYQQMRLGSQSGTHIVNITIPPGSASDGQMVRDLGLPNEVIITSIQRGNQAIIPRGSTVIQGDDRMTLLAMPDQVAELEAHLLHGSVDQHSPRYIECVLPPQAPAVGQAVADLSLPREVLIVTLCRNGQVRAVNGKTRLRAGDELIILAPPEHMRPAMHCLTGEAAE
jgi:CIC family chloride channel protein